jgi:hypothetical protein
MKSALLLVLPVVMISASGQALDYSCNIGEFKHISFTIHEPSERKQLTLSWIKNNRCNREQLVFIYNNLASWLGTADNLEIRNLIEKKYQDGK